MPKTSKITLAGAFVALMVLLVAPGLVGGGRALAAGTMDLQGYKLGAGDKIRVITFGEESLTGEFVVSGAGTVSLPLIGEVNAAGLTTSQVQDEVAARLRAGYINDPHVSVEVLSYRPYYILGEVNKPGEYAYSNGLTVVNAVATATGFTYRASSRRVYIKHAGETREREYPLTSTTLVAPGDTIRIVERFF